MADIELRVTPNQFAAIVLMQQQSASLTSAAQLLGGLGVPILVDAVKSAHATLAKATAQYVDDTQRAVQVASPADLKLVAP